MTIRIDQADLTRVQIRLAGIRNGASTVMMRALNQTLSGAKTDASKLMREQVTAKKKDLDEHITPRKASVADLTAAVHFDHKSIPLSKFEVRAEPLGVSSRIWKRKGWTFHPHAFVGTMRTGHAGAFRREYSRRQGPGTYKAATLGRRVPWKQLPKKYRFPITQLWGPTVKNLMADIEEPLLPKVGNLASERLATNMERQLDYFLSRQ